LAQFHIGLGIGFSAVSIPQLQLEDSTIKVGLTEIAWFGRFLLFCGHNQSAGMLPHPV